MLEKYGENNKNTWESIRKNRGSVQHLEYLSDLELQVFKTAMEMDQHWIIELADQRGKYIDQAQSLNVFFPSGSSRAYVNSVHFKFLKSPNVVTMYYYRTERESNVDTAKTIERQALKDWIPAGDGSECKSCQG